MTLFLTRVNELEQQVANLSAALDSFTPATPVSEVVDGVAVVAQRFRIRRETKERLYARLFNERATSQGYIAEIHRGVFYVYREGETVSNYQAPATHENLLRAYAALRLYCHDSVGEFIQFTGRQSPLTEERVGILPLSPSDDGIPRQFGGIIS